MYQTCGTGIPHEGMVDGKTLWCSDRGHFVEAFMDVPQFIADLYGSGKTSDVFHSVGGSRKNGEFKIFDTSLQRQVWDWNSIYAEMGVLAEIYEPIYVRGSFETQITEFINHLKSLSNIGRALTSAEAIRQNWGNGSGLHYENGKYDYDRIWDEEVRIV